MSEESGVLVLIAVGLLLFFWRILLVVLALAGLVFGLVWLWRVLRLSRLRTICKGADRRFAGDVCRCSQGGFGLLEGIGLEENGGRPRLQLAIRRLCLQDEDFRWCDESLLLAPPADTQALRGNVAFAAFLASHGVEMVNDLAVEAKATRATRACFLEAEWARGALQKMEVMIESTTATLANTADPRVAPQLPLEPGQIPRGKALFVQHQCGQCHVADGGGTMRGPTLDGALHRLQPDYVVALLHQGPSLLPEQRHPATAQFSLVDARALAAYVLSLPAPWPWAEAAAPSPDQGAQP